jgi:predicted MPP superfamily phosphohydrolase
MTAIAPTEEILLSHESANPDGSHWSARQNWEARRRYMERRKAHYDPDGPRSLWRGRIFSSGVRAFGLGAQLVGIRARGRRNVLDVRLVTLSLSFPDLPPAFDGYRILQLSDTHLDCLPDLVPVASRLLAGVQVDLLALTGDVQGHHCSPIDASTLPLSQLLEGVRVNDRRLAVLGNHDPADMAGALERLGFEVLINRSVTLTRRDQHIVVTGLDDVHRFFTPDALRALTETSEGFRIALVHSAEVADHAAAAKYALYLSGHTHGGQICLPGGRPIVTRLRRCRHAGVGKWSEGNMIGYTSCGLGVGEVPLRFNCRGEVTVITLRRSAV